MTAACSKCSALIPAELVYCPVCGADAPTPMDGSVPTPIDEMVQFLAPAPAPIAAPPPSGPDPVQPPPPVAKPAPPPDLEPAVSNKTQPFTPSAAMLGVSADGTIEARLTIALGQDYQVRGSVGRGLR